MNPGQVVILVIFAHQIGRTIPHSFFLVTAVMMMNRLTRTVMSRVSKRAQRTDSGAVLPGFIYLYYLAVLALSCLEIRGADHLVKQK